jgi:hypothetical protein
VLNFNGVHIQHAKHMLRENIVTSAHWFDVRTNIRFIARWRARQQGRIWTALNVTVSGAISQRRVVG